MSSYYDGLKYVYGQLWRVNASAQLVLLHLYHMNNQIGNSGFLMVSDRDLMERTNIKSRETITRTKVELEKAGLIAYETQSSNPRAGTRYEILFYTRGQVSGEKSGQKSVQTSVQREEILLTRAHKTKEPPPPPPPRVDNLTILTRENPLEDKMEELLEAWREDPQMPNLYYEQESKLREMVKKGACTVEELSRAITNAKERNSPDAYGHRGINFNFVLSQLKRKDTKRKVYRVGAVKKAPQKVKPKAVEVPLEVPREVPKAVEVPLEVPKAKVRLKIPVVNSWESMSAEIEAKIKGAIENGSS